MLCDYDPNQLGDVGLSWKSLHCLGSGTGALPQPNVNRLLGLRAFHDDHELQGSPWSVRRLDGRDASVFRNLQGDGLGKRFIDVANVAVGHEFAQCVHDVGHDDTDVDCARHIPCRVFFFFSTHTFLFFFYEAHF